MFDGFAKNRPAQAAFSLTGGSGCSLRVVARADGRSSVRAVTRTAGYSVDKEQQPNGYVSIVKGRDSFC